jgi:1-acyl-sn-glycerol-3-phosphate acyltransferase
VDPIAVDRSEGMSVRQILRDGKKKLESGLWLVMFPESTRLRPEQSVKFKPSAARLAREAKVPIVLMAHNAGIYWPKGFWIEKPGTIEAKIIEVIDKERVEKDEVRSLTDRIETVINREKRILCEQVASKYAA